jgi:hypothetical protein
MPLSLLEMLHFLKLFSINVGEMHAHACLIHSQSCSTSGHLIFPIGVNSCSPAAIAALSAQL